MEPQKLKSILIDSQTLEQLQQNESQELEPIVINLQTLEQLQDDINKEIRELLNNSNLSNVLDKYGISGQDILKVQCSLDLTQFQGRDTDKGHQLVKFLPEILERHQGTVNFSVGGFCKPCPKPGYPRGCWVEPN